jgi:hypothetical protein
METSDEIVNKMKERRTLELVLTVKDLGERLGKIWGICESQASQVARGFESRSSWEIVDKNGHTKYSGFDKTSGELFNKRANDYVFFIGYSDDERRNIFNELNSVCQYAEYIDNVSPGFFEND